MSNNQAHFAKTNGKENKNKGNSNKNDGERANLAAETETAEVVLTGFDVKAMDIEEYGDLDDAFLTILLQHMNQKLLEM